jgi:hypothetical protein
VVVGPEKWDRIYRVALEVNWCIDTKEETEILGKGVGVCPKMGYKCISTAIE